VFDYEKTGAQQASDKRQAGGRSGSETARIVLRNIRDQLTHRASSVALGQEHQNPRVNRGTMLDSNRGFEKERLTHPSIVSSYQFLFEHVIGMNSYANIEQLFLIGGRKEILCREHALDLLARVAGDRCSRQILTMNPVLLRDTLS